LDKIKATFSRPIKDFKQFCQIAQTILPQNYRTIPLDVFLQYSWNIREGQKKSYLELPNKMKYGKWLCPAIQGTWEEIKVEEPTETVREALKYGKKETAKKQTVNGEEIMTYTEYHPFIKNGWFMLSNFAHQQKIGGEDTDAEDKGKDDAITDAEIIEETPQGQLPSSPAAW
jgi:hypothetical protein